MSTHRDGPNPLRPYYIPPSIALPETSASNSTTTITTVPSHRHASIPSTQSLGDSARDLLNDLDYSSYLSEDPGSASEQIKSLLDAAVWKYTSILLAQPMEVAKTILQVNVARADDAALLQGVPPPPPIEEEVRRRPSRYPNEQFDDAEEDEDSDSEISYFTSAATPLNQSLSTPAPRSSKRRRRPISRHDSTAPIPPPSGPVRIYKLQLRDPTSILSVLSQLWHHEGGSGLWKATNSTFIYNVLLRTLETFTRGLLSTMLNIPIPLPQTLTPASPNFTTNILSSPTPIPTLLLTLSTTTLTHLLLSPMDLIRTRLLLTPAGQRPRSLLPLLRSQPSLAPDPQLLPITILHAALPTLATTLTPLLLRQYLNIDPVLTPTAYAISSLFISVFDLLVRLPLETILRRAQLHVLKQQSRQKRLTNLNSGKAPAPQAELETLVEVGEYKGVFGTIWHIVYEEGSHDIKIKSTSGPVKPSRAQARGANARSADLASAWTRRKGQGWGGLYRGWRVGMWGIVGIWGANSIGGGSPGGGMNVEF
ncbi:MAG: mitochondrial fusion and transport protein ugo1 [Cirrosporium novae-zelandiae]|nr:MAG: mitochondrial fusion and transport protein ugo1 [Cirrosporium novae-zelandiae]